MGVHLKKEKLDAFKKEFTILLFELTKNKRNIKGFMNARGRNDAFVRLVYSMDIFHFKNSYLKIFSDFRDIMTLEEVKADSDFCILFTHVGNAKEPDIQLKLHSTDFVELVFFTTEEKISWGEDLSFICLDEEVIYEMELVPADDRR